LKEERFSNRPATQLIALGLAPPHPNESAMVATLQPASIPPTNDLEPAIVENVASGNYTAIVRGVNGTTGIALVEVYALN
jgi:hypothetical protein